VSEVGDPDAGVLIDALHLARTGGVPADVAALPPNLVRSVQLCDGPAASPRTVGEIVAEARGKRLPPGAGELPLSDLLQAVPNDVALSIEAPMDDRRGAEARARHLYEATRRLLAAARP
jgi:sugar phosphate isomerase/epimerase